MLRALLMLYLLSCVVPTSLAQVPQISDGTRVFMSPGYHFDEGRKTNPDLPSFSVVSQPILADILPKDSGKVFKEPDDLLQFYRALPVPIRVKGLWITRLSNGSPRNESDNDRIAAVVNGAAGQDFPVFTCEPREAKKNKHTWLVAWECGMEAPEKGVPFICEPSDKAKQPGPPLWSCTERLTAVPNPSINTDAAR
jgi:hypothetical protein